MGIISDICGAILSVPSVIGDQISTSTGDTSVTQDGDTTTVKTSDGTTVTIKK